jgi:hypothetical protein
VPEGLLPVLLPKAVFLMQILSVEIIGVLKCLEMPSMYWLVAWQR